eukprot:scaffold268460_cov26-Prasinocladus_malaysianus.AAC.1
MFHRLRTLKILDEEVAKKFQSQEKQNRGKPDEMATTSHIGRRRGRGEKTAEILRMYNMQRVWAMLPPWGRGSRSRGRLV